MNDDKPMPRIEAPTGTRPGVQASAGSSESAGPDAPVKILIVDDEPKNLLVLESLLNQPSYQLVRATSGDEALLALVSEEFALLILDISMPDMSGFDLAKTIKARRKTARIPIIFLTAYYNEDQHVIEGYGMGAVDYLLKPVNGAILRSKVAIFVELHRKQRDVVSVNRALLAEVNERRRAEEQLRALTVTLDQRVNERTAALMEANRRKDEFLAMLAHELRNPLAPVHTAVELLHLKGLPTPESQWAADVIDRNLRHLTRLIDDLMDVSRISRGRIQLQREHVDLAQVVQAALEMSRPVIEEKAHELTVQLPPVPIMLDADVTRLTQVFLNLLNNAAKYTERAGRIDLRAELHPTHLSVSVRDTGVGLAADKLQMIFEMFSQVEMALSKSKGGLGIGLYLARQLVELHGGTIDARSEGLGKGSEFVVRLPVASSHTSPGLPSETQAERRAAADLRVLVADDNHDAAAALSIALRLTYSDVRTVCDAEQVLAAVREFRPQVVLCDIGMPRVNGYEICRQIRREPWGKDMILIAVTGWSQPEARMQSAAAGFDHHLVKPVELSVLRSVLAGLNTAKTRSSPPL